MNAVLSDEFQKMLSHLGPGTAKSFQPGLSEAEIDAVLLATGLKLSQELRSLFRLQNGQVTDGHRVERMPFGIYGFYPLAWAVEKASYLAKMNSDWRRSWLPILSNEAGDYYFCDCAQTAESSPVYWYFL